MSAEWFAGRLRELREARGFTQKQLADLAGVSFRGVAQWEQGSREPGWSSVLALCKALNVSCEEFTREPGPHEAKPGRPRKAGDGAPDQAGRKAKAAPADLPPAQGKPARRKPPRPRGG